MLILIHVSPYLTVLLGSKGRKKGVSNDRYVDKDGYRRVYIKMDTEGFAYVGEKAVGRQGKWVIVSALLGLVHYVSQVDLELKTISLPQCLQC